MTRNRQLGIALLALTAIAVVLLGTTGTEITVRTFALAAPGLAIGLVMLVRR
jgi:hypothetical protein